MHGYDSPISRFIRKTVLHSVPLSVRDYGKMICPVRIGPNGLALGRIQIKKFYVASSFKNIDIVRFISMRLVENGFIYTYDWTKNERTSTIEDLKEIGLLEKNAVLDANLVIVLLPAGKGSHIEFGIALGQGKKYIFIRQITI